MEWAALLLGTFLFGVIAGRKSDKDKASSYGSSLDVRHRLRLQGFSLYQRDASPRTHMIGWLQVKKGSWIDGHKCVTCGTVALRLTEVVRVAETDFARLNQVGHVCPKCGYFRKSKHCDGGGFFARMPDGANFFDLLDQCERRPMAPMRLELEEKFGEEERLFEERAREARSRRLALEAKRTGVRYLGTGGPYRGGDGSK